MELIALSVDETKLSHTPRPESSDRELLKCFIAGDESAFAALVQRHAALVLGVCQRILRQRTDAEDAFQATFLVLARKARSLEWQESIAGWLYQTARRTSMKLRASTSRRRDIEGQASQQCAETVESSALKRAEMRELGEILDSELSALPDRFREAILLTQVEGLTRDEAAKRLGISVASVKDRLERAREQLRSKLLRRGITLSVATMAAWLIPETVQAANLGALTATTSNAASAFAAGSLATGTIPTAANLAQGVLHMMGLEKLKYMMAMLLTVVTAGGIAYGMLFDEPTRFEKGLRGNVVAVNSENPSSVTISLEGYDTLLNLEISDQVKVWMAFEEGHVADLKEGQYVSLRLAEDHRTVNEIHIQGEIRQASIKSVAASGKIVIETDGDDEATKKDMEVVLSPNAILRIGGLPASRSELKPGMLVPLEFSRDGKLVNAIEADATEDSMVYGEFAEFDPKSRQLRFMPDCGEEGEPAPPRQFNVVADAIVTLDGQLAKLDDLKKGSGLVIRLSDDRSAIRAIKATSPEPEPPEEPEPSQEGGE